MHITWTGEDSSLTLISNIEVIECFVTQTRADSWRKEVGEGGLRGWEAGS